MHRIIVAKPDPDHHKTCPVCSTLGLSRSERELTFRAFTPAGELIELRITQAHEPLENQDIRWALAQVEMTTMAEPPRLSWKIDWSRLTLFVVFTLLIVTLFRYLPL